MTELELEAQAENSLLFRIAKRKALPNQERMLRVSFHAWMDVQLCFRDQVGLSCHFWVPSFILRKGCQVMHECPSWFN